MKQKFIQSYYDFFDKQIGDSTLVVGLIGIMIFLSGLLSEANMDYAKSNILESTYSSISQKEESIVYIDGKKYKIFLQEFK